MNVVGQVEQSVSVTLSWHDVQYLCPSMSEQLCKDALLQVSPKLYDKVLPYVWERLMLELSEHGYDIEGRECQ